MLFEVFQILGISSSGDASTSESLTRVPAFSYFSRILLANIKRVSGEAAARQD